MNRNKSINKSIEKFAQKHGLTWIYGTCEDGDEFVHFDAEILERQAVLVTKFGIGETIEEAKEDYARQISGKLLVVDAYDDYRREIVVPEFGFIGD